MIGSSTRRLITAREVEAWIPPIDKFAGNYKIAAKLLEWRRSPAGSWASAKGPRSRPSTSRGGASPASWLSEPTWTRRARQQPHFPLCHAPWQNSRCLRKITLVLVRVCEPRPDARVRNSRGPFHRALFLRPGTRKCILFFLSLESFTNYALAILIEAVHAGAGENQIRPDIPIDFP